ncbi:MAG TPA: hypothetical protein VFW07_02270 [Parafilimonas sp.]|nr:hypothetical protein [Parafilimonas sp.]
METERSENLNQKKESFKRTLDDMLHEVETQEELLKALQEKFSKQKKEIRKWLSWMG